MTAPGRASVVSILGSVWALLLAIPAVAQYPPQEQGLTCNTAVVSPGDQIACSAGGFQAQSEVGVFLLSAETRLATMTADAQGRVDFRLTIPTDTSIGAHRMEVRGTGSDGEARVLSFQLSVAKVLAQTGQGHLPLVIGAASVAIGLALGFGAFAWSLGRRRARSVDVTESG